MRHGRVRRASATQRSCPHGCSTLEIEFVPQARLKSLRDLVYFFKNTLGGPDSNFVGQLNAAFSFARHITEGEAIARLSTMISKLEDLGGKGTHNSEGQVVDPRAEEVEQSGRRGILAGPETFEGGAGGEVLAERSSRRGAVSP